MDCPSFGELLAGLDSAECDSKHREAELHVRECPACARLLADCEAAKSRISEALQTLSGDLDDTCPDIERLEALADKSKGEPLTDHGALERHVLRCNACRGFVDGLSGWAGAPDSAFPEPPAAWLFQAASSPPVKPRWMSSKLTLPAGAAALVALGLLFVSRGVLDMQRRQVAPDVFAPVPEAPFPAGRGVVPAPASKPPEERALAFQPEPGGSTEAETVRTRTLGQGAASLAIALRFKTPSGIEELTLPSSREPALFSGGEYGFRIAVSTSPAWLYIYQVDSQNKISALFPNAGYHTASNPIATAGSTLLPDGVGWYRLDETTGEETIYAVRTAEPCGVCEDLLSIASRGDEGPGAASALRRLRRSYGVASGENSSPLITFRFPHRDAPQR